MTHISRSTSQFAPQINDAVEAEVRLRDLENRLSQHLLVWSGDDRDTAGEVAKRRIDKALIVAPLSIQRDELSELLSSIDLASVQAPWLVDELRATDAALSAARSAFFSALDRELGGAITLESHDGSAIELAILQAEHEWIVAVERLHSAQRDAGEKPTDPSALVAVADGGPELAERDEIRHLENRIRFTRRKIAQYQSSNDDHREPGTRGRPPLSKTERIERGLRRIRGMEESIARIEAKLSDPAKRYLTRDRARLERRRLRVSLELAQADERSSAVFLDMLRARIQSKDGEIRRIDAALRDQDPHIWARTGARRLEQIRNEHEEIRRERAVRRAAYEGAWARRQRLVELAEIAC